MRYIISVILLLALFGCKQEDSATISGSLQSDYTEFQLYVIDDWQRETLSVDHETMSFSVSLTCAVPRIVNLVGVIGSGNEKWQFDQPLYIKPGSTLSLKMELANREIKIETDVKDRNNRALIEFRKFNTDKTRSIWMTPPAEDQAQESLKEINARAEEVSKEYRTDKKA